MVYVRAIPTYRFVKSVAGDTSSDPVELAFGKAIDTAIAQYNYYQSRSFKPLLGKALKCCIAVFNRELKRYGVVVDKDKYRAIVARMWRILCAWASSPYTGLYRPRTHVILLHKDNVFYGVYAQPDFIEYRASGLTRFYELKSYDIMVGENRHVWVQAKVFSLLGQLTIIYFTEDSIGYVHIKTVDVDRDYSVLDKLWSFIGSTSNYEEVELEELLALYPVVYYRWVHGKWVEIGNSELNKLLLNK